ncbi:hypothetical protein [Haloferula rosea]|uniref:Uncharacterized protein n=1 Tax=Haloferula rosea TaxID=490093 RepID=A0A934RG31_9BACT|nr:hypothetical protein [Haloferula rosea]MBK1828536.1 hypothetical protein [Haloferula rosea]
MSYTTGVAPPKPDRPFLASWLRRTRKQLAPSGRLTELSMLLAQREGHTREYWAKWLRQVLDNELAPSLDELTTIDALLAKPKSSNPVREEALLPF